MSAHKLLLTICLDLSDQCHCQSTQRSISMVLNFKVRDFIAPSILLFVYFANILERPCVMVIVLDVRTKGLEVETP